MLPDATTIIRSWGRALRNRASLNLLQRLKAMRVRTTLAR